MTSRTPLRVSLFGGGTDYPAYFERHRGAVIGFAINKYIYITARPLAPRLGYRYRLSYSKVETVNDPAELQHPVVRALLGRCQSDGPLDIIVETDLKASAGLGSSSAFTVGFLRLISGLKGTPSSRLELASEAIYVEQKVLGELVGVQDQLHAAFGGFNRFDFRNGTPFAARPIAIVGADLEALAEWMLLVDTGLKRKASEVAAEQVENTSARRIDADLSHLVELADLGQRLLETERGERLPRELARLLDESWRVKRRLSTKISSAEIDALYERCLAEGALGGKLCGAGGGGFLLMLVPPDRQERFRAALAERTCVSFAIDFEGSTLAGRVGG